MNIDLIHDESTTMIGVFGWTLFPFVICVVAAAALIAWKLVDLSVTSARATRLLARIDGLVERHMIAEALAEARAADSAVGRVMASGLARRASGAGQVARSLASSRTIELARLERGLAPLATIAAVSPLLGFLGSVLALMQQLEAGPLLPQVTAATLLPAAFGLALALPVTLMHHYFAARVRRVAIDVTDSAQRAVDAIHALDAGARAPE